MFENKKCRKVAVTGFYGTGSSAVLDLLTEYRNAHAVPEIGRPYEHTTFYSSGGLFDLFTLLTYGNAPLQSDYVLNNFIDKMSQLNDYNYLWFGSFRSLIGNRFMDAVNKFVDSISTHHTGRNFNHVLKTRFSPMKALMQLGAKLIYGKNFSKYGVGYVWDGKPVYYSRPTKEELKSACQQFTNDYFNLFSSEKSELDIYDHLIWPQQLDSHAECFDDSLKIIVVDRDPRDVYISDQFIWSKPPLGTGKQPHFSKDVNSFIDEWRRTITPTYKNKNALRIHFEDLIYNYEQTLIQIESFLDLESLAHENYKTSFIPEKSLNNTQVFLLKPQWKEIADIIASELPQYIYSFPYERVPEKKEIFL